VKQRVAIIGTGIAGMATAYYLRTEYDVTLIEKNNYVGGHTNTVSVSLGHGFYGLQRYDLPTPRAAI